MGRPQGRPIFFTRLSRLSRPSRLSRISRFSSFLDYLGYLGFLGYHPLKSTLTRCDANDCMKCAKKIVLSIWYSDN